MNQPLTEYKQAIIIGASPIGNEAGQLVALLKWAGYGPQDENCDHDCKTCHTGCAGKTIKKDIYLIAADGGLDFLLKNKMMPDFFIGDMDSFAGEYDELSSEKRKTKIPANIPHEIVPVEKDDTDMGLAVANAYEKGYREILLYGGYGGARVSHTLANIQLMSCYAKKGCRICMMGEGIRMEILWKGCKKFSSAMKGNLSVICLSDCAEGVIIRGLKYEYEGRLTSDHALGVSNSFIGQDAEISVQDGTLLLVYER